MARGEKVGVLKVRLYRPFSIEHFVAALPQTVKSIAVLDRTKEPGAGGEPLYLDVVDALAESEPRCQGHRGPLRSLQQGVHPGHGQGRLRRTGQGRAPRSTSPWASTTTSPTPAWSTTRTSAPSRTTWSGPCSTAWARDGTVGANKNSIKIIGEDTDNYAQGYFVYDSKKAGVMTVSHLRFGPEPIRSSYLVNKANFVACHVWAFLEKFDMLSAAVPGATFLLNAPFPAEEVWDKMPREMQQRIIDMKLKLYAINAYEVAKETGMGGRINTIMQTCFFYLSSILPQDEAIAAIKKAIEKTYGKRGEKVVQMNYNAVDQAIAASARDLRARRRPPATIAKPPVVPERRRSSCRRSRPPSWPAEATSCRSATCRPTAPGPPTPPSGRSATSPSRSRCGSRSSASSAASAPSTARTPPSAPRSTTRPLLAGAPATFKSVDAKGKEFAGMKWTVQVAPEDCTGCGACVHICPGKDKADPEPQGHQHGLPAAAARERARQLRVLPEPSPIPTAPQVRVDSVKGSQLLRAPVRVSREPAPAAGRRPTSSCSPSSSATACSSATPPAAPASTGATCPPRPTPRTPTAGARPGTTPSSRTRPSSATACA